MEPRDTALGADPQLLDGEEKAPQQDLNPKAPRQDLNPKHEGDAGDSTDGTEIRHSRME